MNILERYMTLNDCYKANRYITVKGLVVHSTATPGVMAADWFSRWNKPGTSKCVHAFLDDKEVCQYLPWNMRGWHAGASANNTHIGIEMCEPKNLYDTAYFNSAYQNFVDVAVMLCKKYGFTEKNIISHAEGYRLGICTNHGDPHHWWKLHNKTMDDFRADVRAGLNTKPAEAPKVTNPKTVREVQQYLRDRGYNLTADGYTGPITRKSLIMHWQKTVGGLTVDGSFGPASKAAAAKNNLRLGSKGELVRIMQMTLVLKGYDMSTYGSDASFGPSTEKVVRKYQAEHGLGSDGICGSGTLTSLFN